MTTNTTTGTAQLPERLRYFHGQTLVAADFRDEQTYLRDKIRLLARCLGGRGVACGFDVGPLEEPDYCVPPTVPGCDDDPPWIDHAVVVSPGMAVDCAGNLLLSTSTHVVKPFRLLPAADRPAVESGSIERLHVTVHYCEIPRRPSRPMGTHSCVEANRCEHARILESISIRVGVEPPHDDRCCDGCCNDCCGPDGSPGCCCDKETCHHGVLLAELAVELDDETGQPAIVSIHNEYKPMLARQRPATIVGINWWHGATYDVGDATALAADGFVFELSDDVLTETLTPGVVDVVVHQGGRGNVGGIYYVPGGIVDPGTPYTDRIIWKSDTDETFQNGDRIVVTLRGDFILDRCCRALDANHIGGRLPVIDGAIEPVGYQPATVCLSPPNRSGPWSSGDGTAGGLFESWITIGSDTGKEY